MKEVALQRRTNWKFGAGRKLGRRTAFASPYFDRVAGYSHKLVTLLDRNPYRETYGCFDREYWHYRTSDFPCAMHQASVLPLVILSQRPHPGNPLYGSERVRDWAIAAMRFAMNSAHRDASGDDYYPFERALGATAFSLYSFTESYLRLGLDEPELVEFFERRARWIASHREPGVISNHHALAALCLTNLAEITGADEYAELAAAKISEVVEQQSPEGWFREYDGCDPGYTTWTLDYLAQIYVRTGNEELRPVLEKAVEFCAQFVHPDGTFAGGYGSRDSFNFFPHGFELLASRIPRAAWIAERFRAAVGAGLHPRFDDDRVFQHHFENYLLAHEVMVERTENPEAEPPVYEEATWLPEAGLFALRKSDLSLFVSAHKCGSFRLYRGTSSLCMDAGYIGEIENDGVIVSNTVDTDRIVKISENSLRVSGTFHESSMQYATPFKQIVFRVLLLLTGFSPRISRLTKALLQSILVLGKRGAPVRLEREFDWSDGLKIRDHIELDDDVCIARMSTGPDFTSRYTAIGDVSHDAALDPWNSVDVDTLNAERSLELRRSFAGGR